MEASRRRDILAGITVTAYLIPQVMAYAGIAGLDPSAGIWAAVGALVAYAALGSSGQLSVGPESTTALMTAAALATAGPQRVDDLAVALALVVAGFCGLAWLARLSFVAELFSRPVLVGYMTGVAALMVISQIPKLIGIEAGSTDGMLGELGHAARHALDAHTATTVIGLVTLAVMLVVARWRPHAPVALLGIVGASVAVQLAAGTASGVALVDDVATRGPELGVPSVALDEVVALLVPALGVAFVAYTDNILTARAFAVRHKEQIDARRELLALGAANVGAALLHGFPVSSSGSRTAIVDAAGGRTRLVALVTAAATAAAALLLAPALALIPATALAAVVVYAATRLIEIDEFRRFARFRRSELVLAAATTVAVLAVGVLNGVLVAVGLSLLDLLRRVARPKAAVEGFVEGVAGMHDIDDYPDARTLPGLVVYRYDSPLFFANAEDFRVRVLEAVATETEPVRWLLLNTEAMSEVDLTACDVLESIRADLAARGITLALARVKQDLLQQLDRAGLIERIGREHVFPTLPTAVAAFEALGRRGDVA